MIALHMSLKLRYESTFDVNKFNGYSQEKFVLPVNCIFSAWTLFSLRWYPSPIEAIQGGARNRGSIARGVCQEEARILEH